MLLIILPIVNNKTKKILKFEVYELGKAEAHFYCDSLLFHHLHL